MGRASEPGGRALSYYNFSKFSYYLAYILDQNLDLINISPLQPVWWGFWLRRLCLQLRRLCPFFAKTKSTPSPKPGVWQKLLILLQGLWSNDLFYKMFNYMNSKWDNFSHFHASDQKKYLTKCFSILARSSKLKIKTGNRIIRAENVNIDFISGDDQKSLKARISYFIF